LCFAKSYPQRSSFARGHALCPTLRLLNVLQDTSCIAQIKLPSRAQLDAPRQSVEQDKSKLVLQVANLSRQRGLSDTKALGVSSEVFFLPHSNKVTQMSQLHPIPQ
jgi:hypothetical protein